MSRLIYLMLCIGIAFGVMSATAQDNTPLFDITQAGIDVVVVMENSARMTNPRREIAQSDPNTLRFEAVEFIAKVLADNALFYRPKAINRLSLVTYSAQGASVQVNHLPFGPFDRTLRDADLTQYNEQLQALTTINLRGIPTDPSPQTDGFHAPDGVPAVLRQLIPTNSPRQTIVLVVSAGISQSANPELDISQFLQRLDNFTKNVTLDFFYLNNLNSAFDMSRTVNPAARVWEVLQTQRPAGLPGNQYILTEDIPDPTKSVARLPYFFLESIIPHLGVEALDLGTDTSPTITIPPFVSVMTLISFAPDAQSITTPTGISRTARVIDSRSRNGAVQTYIAPVPGEYRLNNVSSAKAFLRMGTATLDTPQNVPQLVAQPLGLTIRDAFNNVFDYANVGDLPVFTANLRQIPGDSWSIPLISADNGIYTATFVPPYAGNYTLDVSYTLPLVASNAALNTDLPLAQNIPNTRFSVSALSLAIDDEMRQFEMFQPKDVRVVVNGANNQPLQGNPHIRMQLPTGMRSTTRDNVPLNAGYHVDYRGMTSGTLTPNPAEFVVSLWATLQANSTGTTNYQIIGDTAFSVRVDAPAMTITPTRDNVILRAVGLTIGDTRLTSAQLTDFNARVCATIQPGADEIRIPFDMALTADDFIPYTPDDYAYVVNIHQANCNGAILARVGAGSFRVDPLYIGFLDGDTATTIRTLHEYLPYNTQLGLFVQRDDIRYERYTDDLTDIPRIQADNPDVSIDSYSNNVYAVRIAPQIAPNQTNALTFTLSPVGTAQPVSLPIYTGISVQSDGRVTIPIQRATVMLAPVTARQFNNATFAVTITSTQAETVFDARDVNDNNWTVLLNLSHDVGAWQIPLTYANNQYQKTVPIPFGGTYNASVTITSNRGDVTYLLSPTEATGLTLAGVNNPVQVEEETTTTFVYRWLDGATHITQFDNLPDIRFSVTKRDNTVHQPEQTVPLVDNQYTYTVTFHKEQAGEYFINASWTTKAPDNSNIQQQAQLTIPSLVVGNVSGFNIVLDGQPIQTYFIPILPLVNTGLRQNRILVANIGLMGDMGSIPLYDAFPNLSRNDLIVRLRLGDGQCASFTSGADCVLDANRWQLRPDETMGRIEISDVIDNTPYQIEVALASGVLPQTGYRLRANTSTLPMQLRLNNLTIALPIFYGVITLVLTSIAFLIVRILIHHRDSRPPTLHGFLRFEDSDGKRIEWQEDLTARQRNRIDIRRDMRLRGVNVRRLVVNTIDGKPNEVMVRAWWAPPRRWSTLLLRLLPLDQLPARVKRQLSLDKPQSLFVGSSYLVYSHTPKQTAQGQATTSGRHRFMQMGEQLMETASMPIADIPIPTKTGLKPPTSYVPPPPTHTPPTPSNIPSSSIGYLEQPTMLLSSSVIEQPSEEPTISQRPPTPPRITPEDDSETLPPPSRRRFTQDDDDPFNT